MNSDEPRLVVCMLKGFSKLDESGKKKFIRYLEALRDIEAPASFSCLKVPKKFAIPVKRQDP